ncbi:MAG: amylo-alpha-1,6-glucosidase [bacterium]
MISLKEDRVFAVCDSGGDMRSGVEGLYYLDTRFLNEFTVSFDEFEPVLLSSSAGGSEFSAVLANPPYSRGGESVRGHSVSIEKSVFIKDNLYVEIRITNYGRAPVETTLHLKFDGDFKHIFEVRGYTPSGGKPPERLVEKERGRVGVGLKYVGRDGVTYQTLISLDPEPGKITSEEASYIVSLNPHESFEIRATVKPVVNGNRHDLSFEEARSALERERQLWLSSTTDISTDNDSINEIIERSRADIRNLLFGLDGEILPAAGIPFFVVPFGRDSIITSLQCMILNPDIGRGTLKTLARYQGERVDPWRDEEPGKIMHELRFGELANTNAIPHSPYYGTVDATPLFIILASEYCRWTHDLDFARELLPAVERALIWIDRYGDPDGDGYVEYLRKSEGGLSNQAWKDSSDSVPHKDGELARGPIAIAEVQGYAYDAKMRAAELYGLLGDAVPAYSNRRAELEREARELKERFNRDFWMDDEGFFALALDGEKRRVETVTSNPGHCLWSGIVDENKAGRVVKRLLEPDMFSGWGVRTMSTKEVSYNPISYHNGSVWPHDNSLIILGMARYGYVKEACVVIRGLLDAAKHFPGGRLPELFCGYSRERYKFPVPYPVACSPQAWAAGSIYAILQALLGLEFDARRNIISLYPYLPPSLHSLRSLGIRGLRLGGSTLNLRVYRKDDKTVCEVEKEKGLQVVVRG